MLSTFSVVSLFPSWLFVATIAPAYSAHARTPEFPVMPRQYNDSNVHVNLPNDTKKFYANNLCTPERIQIEQVAWSDALMYALALASWRVNSTYQEAMDIYMGNDTRGPLGRVVEGTYLDGSTTLDQWTLC